MVSSVVLISCFEGIPEGKAMLLDGAQIGAADGGTVGDTSGQADIEMRDDPTSNVGHAEPAASLVSMFQTDSSRDEIDRDDCRGPAERNGRGPCSWKT